LSQKDREMTVLVSELRNIGLTNVANSTRRRKRKNEVKKNNGVL
jgi:hypothetical protein